MRNILEVTTNKRGTIFTIYIGMQHDQKYKIKKAYRKNTKEKLEIWCDKYGLNYRERRFL